MSTLDELRAAVAGWRDRVHDLLLAQDARDEAHRAHRETIPLLGRVRVGNGDDRTRKAHHAACSRVAVAGLGLEAAEARLVAAAVAHVDSLDGTDHTQNGPDAAHGVSDSDPAVSEGGCV